MPELLVQSLERVAVATGNGVDRGTGHRRDFVEGEIPPELQRDDFALIFGQGLQRLFHDGGGLFLFGLQDQEKRKQAKKRFYEKHKEQLLAGCAAYRKDNAVQRKAYFVLYKKENAIRVAAWNAARRAAKIQRTPEWLDEDDFWMMEQAYELAALRTEMFGFVWHVDHILPLKGKTISGLHVPTNLQVIPALHNLAKGNRFAVGV